MNIKNKIARFKDKAANLAVKTAAAATLMTGTGAVSSCKNQERDEDFKKEKTSVVVRSTHNSYRSALDNDTDILLENGDEVRVEEYFLEPGDTVTYEKRRSYESLRGKQITEADVKTVRYKDGSSCQNQERDYDEDFREDGSSCQNQERDNDEDFREEKTSVVVRSTHHSHENPEDNDTEILLENGDKLRVDENFLEPGDTVTYEKTKSYENYRGKQITDANVKAVRYKDGTGKNINFGRIKMREGR